jgi:phosphodiesterase/alkaline phosphatase D-like protein
MILHKEMIKKYIIASLSVLVFALSLLTLFPSSAHAATMTHGAVLGSLTDTGVKVWIRTDAAATFKVEYKLAAGAYPGTITSGLSLTSGTDFTGAIQLSGLTANTAYAYRVLVDDVVQAGTGSSGTFTTFPAVDSACHYTFTSIGDLSYALVSPLDFAFPDVTSTTNLLA